MSDDGKATLEREELAAVSAMLPKDIAATIPLVMGAFKADFDAAVAATGNEQEKIRLRRELDNMYDDIEKMLNSNLVSLENNMNFQALFRQFQALLVPLSNNINLREEYVRDTRLKFNYLDPKLVPSSLSA